MPFTPLHMGPGMVVKAAMPRHFSIIVFGATQIAIDIEVLRYLMRGDYPLHGFWHTYLGATIVAIGFGVIGKPISQWIKRMWNCLAPKSKAIDLSAAVPTTWTASLSGAFIGLYSHILLDSLYHTDIMPLQPFSNTNHLRGYMSPYTLDILCVAAGIIGLIWFFTRQARQKMADNAVLPVAAGAAQADR